VRFAARAQFFLVFIECGAALFLLRFADVRTKGQRRHVAPHQVQLPLELNLRCPLKIEVTLKVQNLLCNTRGVVSAKFGIHQVERKLAYV
jgi:hypothetical protein